jgi:hypothetical protein
MPPEERAIEDLRKVFESDMGSSRRKRRNASFTTTRMQKMTGVSMTSTSLMGESIAEDAYVWCSRTKAAGLRVFSLDGK